MDYHSLLDAAELDCLLALLVLLALVLVVGEFEAKLVVVLHREEGLLV